jgi:hypothetical protein
MKSIKINKKILIRRLIEPMTVEILQKAARREGISENGELAWQLNKANPSPEYIYSEKKVYDMKYTFLSIYLIITLQKRVCTNTNFIKTQTAC